MSAKFRRGTSEHTNSTDHPVQCAQMVWTISTLTCFLVYQLYGNSVKTHADIPFFHLSLPGRQPSWRDARFIRSCVSCRQDVFSSTALCKLVRSKSNIHGERLLWVKNVVVFLVPLSAQLCTTHHEYLLWLFPCTARLKPCGLVKLRQAVY